MMNKHIRFRQGLASYQKGTSHHLPVELADMYVRAGVAEEVDSVPAKSESKTAKKEPTAVETDEESAAEEPEADDSEVNADDDDTGKKTTRRRRRKS